MDLVVADLPTVKVLEARIKSIAAAGTKLQSVIHETALACLGHACAHGDVRLFQKLYETMPVGQRRKALAHWAMNASPIFLFDDKKTGIRCGLYNEKKHPKAFKPWAWETLAGTPYYALESADEKLRADTDKLEKQIAAMTAGDLMGMIKKLADRVEKDLSDPQKAPANEAELAVVTQKLGQLRALAA